MLVTTCQRHYIQLLISTLLLICTLCTASSCAEKEPPPEIIRPDAAPNPLPRFLRGTMRYEADLRGYGPAVVQGYGLVVDLDGTGSSDVPITIRGLLERDVAPMLTDPKVSDDGNLNFETLLNSPNTAVVYIEGIVPPGATKGSHIDLVVRALPSTSTTSIEGGKLWTSYLRLGESVGGGSQLDIMAKGKGEIFINPFAKVLDTPTPTTDPDDPDALPKAPRPVVVEHRIGRVLNGGILTANMRLMLELRIPSFGRSRIMTNAINSRFPQEIRQAKPTAVPVVGQSDERIMITVPPSWSDKTSDFVEILMHTPLSPMGLESRANALVRWLKENPADAQAVTWCWVAIGPKSIPMIKELYTYSETVPRLAAMKAGAKLGDPIVVAPLTSLANNSYNPLRIAAVELLGDMPYGARIGTTLRELINDPDQRVRIAAFESMYTQNDAIIRHIPVRQDATFKLIHVNCDYPMVYVRQQSEPMIVVFGNQLEIKRPLLVSAWGGRLMVANETGTEDPLRVFYQLPRTNEAKQYDRNADIVDFIRFLARLEGYNPAGPGLGFTYAQTIGALYAFHANNALEGPLVLEHDTILAAIQATNKQNRPDIRPETSEERADIIERLKGFEDREQIKE